MTVRVVPLYLMPMDEEDRVWGLYTRVALGWRLAVAGFRIMRMQRNGS